MICFQNLPLSSEDIEVILDFLSGKTLETSFMCQDCMV